jgi:hypothetical protein
MGVMEINKFNKKIISNLILGSSLCGISIITTVQATQQAGTPRQETLRRQSEARRMFEHRMRCGPDLSLEECMEFVQKCEDVTVQGGLLTLLEEAILSRSPKAVNIFIKYNADIDKVSEKVKDTYKDGFTLLHFALLSPQEMKEFCKYKNIDKAKPVPQTLHERFVDMQRKNREQLLGITDPDTSPKESLSAPYASKEIVEILLDSLKQNPSRLEQYVNKSYKRIGSQGKTEEIKPLDLAIENQNKELESHPELNQKIQNEYANIIQLLLEHGAECSVKNNNLLLQRMKPGLIQAEIQRKKGR